MPLKISLQRGETGKQIIYTARINEHLVSLCRNYLGRVTYSQLLPDGKYLDCSIEELKEWLELLPVSTHRSELQEYIDELSA